MERVQKIIANAGVCSRRKAEELIAEGLVQVNGKTITLGDKASESDTIIVDGEALPKQKKLYKAFNKPKFVLTALGDPSGRPTVKDFIDMDERVYPTGRLDYNAEGLLILTNDGEFANLILHPSYEMEKEYSIWLDKPLHPKDQLALKKGIILKDGRAKADSIKAKKDRVEMVIHEGRHKIVKRMFKELGYHVDRLIRTRVGPVSLGNLKEGKMRNLLPVEIEKIKLFSTKKNIKKKPSTQPKEELPKKKSQKPLRRKKKDYIIRKNA